MTDIIHQSPLRGAWRGVGWCGRRGRPVAGQRCRPFLLVLGAICLLGIGFLVGFLVFEKESSGPQELKAREIGNPKDGRELFVSQGCSMCHTYEGRGGTDAPDLDFMRGKMTANDIANMSGTIWDHLPTMHAAFEEEEIPFPEFKGKQMASLIAYLHGGGPPPEAPKSGSEEQRMGGEKGSGMHMGGG